MQLKSYYINSCYSNNNITISNNLATCKLNWKYRREKNKPPAEVSDNRLTPKKSLSN